MRQILCLVLLISIIVQCQRYQTYYNYEKQYEWPTVCLVGKRQSPINIEISQTQRCPSNISLSVAKASPNAQLYVHRIENTKDLENPFEQQTFVKLIQNGIQSNYKSLEIHWHTPSEHTINGKHFDMELHIVHKSPDGKIAVTGLFFYMVSDGTPTTFDDMNLAQAQNDIINFPWELDKKFVFHYKGSLTTPPCSEVVDWFVYLEPYPISKLQLQKIKVIKNNGKHNSRNVQKLYQRPVYFLSPDCGKA